MLTAAQLSDLPDWIAALVFRRWYEQSIKVVGPFDDWLLTEMLRVDPYYGENIDAGRTREAFARMAERLNNLERKV